jgi:hypothetical protein
MPEESEVGGKRTLTNLATPAGIGLALRVAKMLGGAISFHGPWRIVDHFKKSNGSTYWGTSLIRTPLGKPYGPRHRASAES